MAADKALSLEEVAAILQVSERTVIRQINAGKLRAFKVGKSWRFRREAVDAYMREQEASAAGNDTDDDEEGFISLSGQALVSSTHLLRSWLAFSL